MRSVNVVLQVDLRYRVEFISGSGTLTITVFYDHSGRGEFLDDVIAWLSEGRMPSDALFREGTNQNG